MKNLLVFIGPSGVGKSALAISLVRMGVIDLHPTWTTRPRRSYEPEEALDHIFVTEQEFDKKITEGGFLGVARPFGLPFSYGLPRFDSTRGKVPAIILRASLLPELYRHFKELVIYQVERNAQDVSLHIKSREKEGALQRLEQYKTELEAGRQWADRILLNDGSIADVSHQAHDLLKADFPGFFMHGLEAASM